MGVVDRLDALDRRLGLRRAPRLRLGPRPPWTIPLGFVPWGLEYLGLLSTITRDYPRGVEAVLTVFALLLVWIGSVIALWTPRTWALRLLLFAQAAMTIRIIYRGIVEGPAGRLFGLLVVAAAVALLLSRQSRRYYRGDWFARQ